MGAQVARWFGEVDRDTCRFTVREVDGSFSPYGEPYDVHLNSLSNAETFKVAAGFGLNPKHYRSLRDRQDAIRFAINDGSEWNVKNRRPRESTPTPTPTWTPTPTPTAVPEVVSAPVAPVTRSTGPTYGEPVSIDGAHFLTPQIMAAADQGLNLFLVGPAGTGKSTIGESVATHLGLKFLSMSIDPSMMRDSIFGFVSPITGDYCGTIVQEWFEHGEAVLMLDELDNGHPSIIGGTNQILANAIASFPHGMIRKADRAICFASGNTYGTGPDATYVGRAPLDGATLDRFVRIMVPVDEPLEEALALGTDLPTATWAPEIHPDGTKARWLAHVRKVRHNVDTAGIRAIVSPRASMHGARLIDAGWSWTAIEDSVLFAGMTADTRRKAEGR